MNFFLVKIFFFLIVFFFLSCLFWNVSDQDILINFGCINVRHICKICERHFLIFHPEDMFNLCLTFNESQSIYVYRHYKKACNLTHYHKYINVFSYNNLTYSVSVEPLQLGTIFHLFGLRCISVNYATLIRNQKNPRVNEFLVSELNQMFQNCSCDLQRGIQDCCNIQGGVLCHNS